MGRLITFTLLSALLRHTPLKGCANQSFYEGLVNQFDIDSRGLAFVGRNFITDFLAIIKLMKTCCLQSRDVHEYVLISLIRSNKSISLIGVEPFNGTSRHEYLSSSLALDHFPESFRENKSS